MNTEKIIKDIFFGNLHEAKDDIASLLLQKVGYALEEKKKRLDPVGEGDDDIDNDGDSDESDEYLKNRRKKISKAIKEKWDRTPMQWIGDDAARQNWRKGLDWRGNPPNIRDTHPGISDDEIQDAIERGILDPAGDWIIN
jgi:hypothetical protein